MYNLVMTLLIIVSILIVIATMMQPQKQQDALNALS
ncbi:MAG: preprotein translocase subunit SecG, partial [Lactobacillus crispatus]